MKTLSGMTTLNLYVSKYFAYQSRGKEQSKTVNTALYTQIQATGERNTKNEKRRKYRKIYGCCQE